MNRKKLNLTFVVDNPNNWMLPYVEEFIRKFKKKYNIILIHDHHQIPHGDISFFLGCEKKISNKNLKRNKHNLVVHGSKLPKGKGWSPLTWQILQGKKKITVTLFEAQSEIDSGPIYLQKEIRFDGSELIDELRKKQAIATKKLIIEFLKLYPDLSSKKQRGKETYYPKRFPKDSKLSMDKTIREQFNLLRIVDNERYPAFFNYRGCTYIIKIYKKK